MLESFSPQLVLRANVYTVLSYSIYRENRVVTTSPTMPSRHREGKV
jgi:hypothetical protein